VPLVIIVIGASGIIAQIVLIRELLVSFQGNELSIGLILGNWLITEALGSFLFRKIKITIQSYKAIVLIFSIIFPILCIIANLIRPIIGLLPGEITTLPIIFLSSFLILLPIGFLHGALFTMSTALLSTQRNDNQRKIPGLVYILENTGTIAGGILTSFILIKYFNIIQVAAGVAIISIFSIIRFNRKFSLYYYPLILLFGLVFLNSSHIEKWTLSKNYPHYQVINSTNTIYGNITTVKREEQYTFLVDGIPTISSPNPDRAFIEDFVHFPFLIHNNANRILIIGGGVGGVITEIFKHPVQEIVYLEINPFLIKTIMKFPTRLTEPELNNPKVRLVYQDARSFFNKDTNHFDLILINYATPQSLQANRLFTKEFYQSCESKLAVNGLLVTRTVGSLAYLSPTLRNIINTHLNTLLSVFPYNYIIPGDYNLYLSSAQAPLTNFNAETLFNRLTQKKIDTGMFSFGYIQYRISKYNIDWLKQSLLSTANNKSINQDGSPRGLFYSLYHSNIIANPKLAKLFSVINKINLPVILVFLLVVSLILLAFRNKSGLHLYLPFTIFTTGIVGMVFSLVLSLGFQIRYGFLYYQISILITTFIAGSVFGGYLGNTHFSDRLKNFLLTEISMIFLLFVLLLASKNRAYPVIFNNYLDFYLFLFISGLLVGIQFPLANRLFKQSLVTNTIGKLYAADLLGGFLSAILVSFVFIPVLGVYQTIISSIILKTISACLLLTTHLFPNVVSSE
jgi:spermidine synthase